MGRRGTAGPPHPVCPRPEVELGPLCLKQQHQAKASEPWCSSASVSRVTLPCKAASRERGASLTQNDAQGF